MVFVKQSPPLVLLVLPATEDSSLEDFYNDSNKQK